MTGKGTQIETKKDGFSGQRTVYLPGIVKKKILKDPRVKDLYITHIGIFPKAAGHLRMRPLGASQYILLYCTEGKGWIEISGKKRIMEANKMIVIDAKTPCSYGADKDTPWTNYWIHFTGENALNYSPQTSRIIDIPPAIDSRIEERLLLFEDMLQNIEDYFNFEKVVYANICLKQFLASVKYLDVYRSVKKEPWNDTLKNIVAFMKNNLHKNIRVNDIARKYNYSSSNIYKLFRNNLATSPLDFFIHLKIEKACKYLSHSNLKIKEIGRKLGYDDPYYFSRIFSKHIGMSPAKYRK